MLNDLSLDALLKGFHLGAGQGDSCQVRSGLHEHSVDLVACLRTNVVLIHRVGLRKLRVQILLYRLHVVQVDFVPEQHHQGKVPAFESFLDQLMPVFKVLERLLICNIVC